ncbi:MAG: hypothetical protein AAFO01_04005 [Pseudomonadota bacterium]
MTMCWVKGLVLPALLLTLLAACQSGVNPRNVGYGHAYTSYGYGACGRHPCATPQRCPPGYVLARIPIAKGGGRYCEPYYTYRRGCCEPKRPPVCLGQGCYGGARYPIY